MITGLASKMTWSQHHGPAASPELRFADTSSRQGCARPSKRDRVLTIEAESEFAENIRGVDGGARIWPSR